MPNHCSNIVTFYGKTEVIKKIKAKIAEHKENNFIEALFPIPKIYEHLDSWNKHIINGKEECPTIKEGDGLYRKLDAFERVQLKEAGCESEHNWCLHNWGTKWGAYDVGEQLTPLHELLSDYLCSEVDEPDGSEDTFQYDADLSLNESISFTYQTAWCPATNGFASIAKEYGVLIAHAYYESGADFCGYEVIGVDGKEDEMNDHYFSEDSDNIIDTDSWEYVDSIPEGADEDDYVRVSDLLRAIEKIC
jgi:hypothetical protein